MKIGIQKIPRGFAKKWIEYCDEQNIPYKLIDVYSSDANIDKKVLKIALETTRKLKMNSIAYDFVYDDQEKPVIIEITYAFGTKGANKAPGYWDENFNWNEEILDNFQYWMVENLIKQFQYKDDN